MKSISPESERRFIEAAFVRAGLPTADAVQIASPMTDADLQGSDGHGVIRLPQYLKRIKAGGINKHPNIRVVQERAATALIDGDNGMGHQVASAAVEVAIRKAREAGIGWVSTRYSNHAGPASLYAMRPLAENMLCLYFAVGNANHMPPWGGSEMLLSTNPIAAAIPTATEPPVVLDMATTAAAYGKVKAKAKAGEAMPAGWMIDKQGMPLLDPHRAQEGFLLPIGGYKGYGLALIVGLLAGTLGGAAMGRDVVDFNADSVSTTNTGQAMLVVDPAAFGPVDVFKGAVDKLVRDLRHSKRLPGVDRIWLPGEQSHERRVRNAQHGIPMPETLVAELDALAGELGIAPLSEAVS